MFFFYENALCVLCMISYFLSILYFYKLYFQNGGYVGGRYIVNRGYSGVLFAIAIFVNNKMLVIP